MQSDGWVWSQTTACFKKLAACYRRASQLAPFIFSVGYTWEWSRRGKDTATRLPPRLSMAMRSIPTMSLHSYDWQLPLAFRRLEREWEALRAIAQGHTDNAEAY